MLLDQLCQGFLKSILLLLFNREVPFSFLLTGLRVECAFGFDVVYLLQGFAQLLWVFAKEVKSTGQLVFCVRELLTCWVSVQHASELNPCAHRVPRVIPKSRVAALFFCGWKAVRRNQEHSRFVRYLELLVETFTHTSTLTLKEKFCYGKVRFIEGSRWTELFASDELSFQVGPVGHGDGHELSPPLNFVASEDFSNAPDKLRLSWRRLVIHPTHTNFGGALFV